MAEPTFQIPKDVIEPIIQAQVTKAVMEALGGYRPIIEECVSQALNVKVDSNGNKPSYSSSHDIPWIQWLVRDTIRTATKKAVVEMLQQHQDAIKASIEKQMRDPKSGFAKGLVDGLVKGISGDIGWKINMDVVLGNR